jgi:hypothetical protein
MTASNGLPGQWLAQCGHHPYTPKLRDVLYTHTHTQINNSDAFT